MKKFLIFCVFFANVQPDFTILFSLGWPVAGFEPLLPGSLVKPGNTKGGSVTVPLTSCLIGLDESVLQIKTKNVSCHTADSKPVKQ
jgi:hypothetical protein